MSLANQAQMAALFQIESDGVPPSEDVIFLETKISFALPDLSNCVLETHGADDYIGAPIILDDGQSCYVEKDCPGLEGKYPTNDFTASVTGALSGRRPFGMLPKGVDQIIERG
jgi:hypothetical protein